MALSDEEKAVGRAFRDNAQSRLSASFDTDPPTYAIPTFLAVYRHSCPARNNRSTAIELREVYLTCEEAGTVPAGRFAFIYKEGRCRLCGHTARSTPGRLVDGWNRPPLSGRVARS